MFVTETTEQRQHRLRHKLPPLRIVCPMYPFRDECESLACFAEPGKRFATTVDVVIGYQCDYEDGDHISGFCPDIREQVIEVYVPTDDELRVMSEAFPGHDLTKPTWDLVQLEFVRRGLVRSDWPEVAPAIIALLGLSKKGAEVPDDVVTKEPTRTQIARVLRAVKSVGKNASPKLVLNAMKLDNSLNRGMREQTFRLCLNVLKGRREFSGYKRTRKAKG